MLNLVIRFSLLTPVLYMACKLAVSAHYQKVAEYAPLIEIAEKVLGG